ncbi:hypothetical protein FB459_2204 [Yimella lutea]|uniref:Uncharacterized protein n=1 Tax=Yimella lutea TaxID=587872 RepID=A0A542EHC8_9MICO|nr:hypothetical protein [Yimella lutea]TQJ14704.1 hypothetical protein FB459_2204 [Yimella lutea]
MKKISTATMEFVEDLPFAHGIVLAELLDGHLDAALESLNQNGEHLTDLELNDVFARAARFDFATGTAVMKVLSGDVGGAAKAIEFRASQGGAQAAPKAAKPAPKKKAVPKPVAEQQPEPKPEPAPEPVEPKVPEDAPAPEPDLPWDHSGSDYDPFSNATSGYVPEFGDNF